MPSTTPPPAPTAFEIAQFVVNVVSVAATLTLAIAALLIAYRAHRLNERVRGEGIERAERADREAFLLSLNAYRDEIMRMYATPADKRLASDVYTALAPSAIARGASYVGVLGMWRSLEEEARATPVDGTITRTIGGVLGTASVITSRWVADPNEPLPNPLPTIAAAISQPPS